MNVPKWDIMQYRLVQPLRETGDEELSEAVGYKFIMPRLFIVRRNASEIFFSREKAQHG